jgi:diadenosine tetraphosphate (Ap4A) HIT family hydrolase
MIFYETDNFYLALTKGPIVNEHFLIVPKLHISSVIDLSEEMTSEFNQLKQKVLQYITSKLGLDYVLFERNIPFKFEKASHMNI